MLCKICRHPPEEPNSETACLEQYFNDFIGVIFILFVKWLKDDKINDLKYTNR